MKTQGFLQAAALAIFALALALMTMPAPSAQAFDPPWPSGIPWPTSVPWPTANPLTIGVPWSPDVQPYGVATPTPIPVSSFVSPGVPVTASAVSTVQGGSSRLDALAPTDSFQTLASGSSVWYRIGTGGEHIEVWLDANPHVGVSMAIYAPNGSDKPVGRGTPLNSDPARLYWAGGNWRIGGTWFALITNGNPFPVQYRLGRAGRDISNKSCYSYWEYIGPNPVYWTKCE